MKSALIFNRSCVATPHPLVHIEEVKPRFIHHATARAPAKVNLSRSHFARHDQRMGSEDWVDNAPLNGDGDRVAV